ncbi:uncharacterized protein [Blastocystis hominis]|uniref:Myb-like domain-containing protein n=1 Tax=Blastocystis hominis TaxID=12968 RepID=D8M163_BLAHO|nr:uncharacterized protein [Blastocystis hominis]CBK21802.2 unnamed protein product [Blastocystis hominis]|eukprot:XP_012895850.1 uncharacterized protein [Blastocystis hominis]
MVSFPGVKLRSECIQQYDYLIHPEKYTSASQTQEKKQSRVKRESEEKHKRRYVRKAIHTPSPSRVSQPILPPDYYNWTSARQAAWNEIPFNANEYYMKYLPPGIEPSTRCWDAEERSEFLSALKNYPPKGKWGLFSLHMLGRTGKEVRKGGRVET